MFHSNFLFSCFTVDVDVLLGHEKTIEMQQPVSQSLITLFNCQNSHQFILFWRAQYAILQQRHQHLQLGLCSAWAKCDDLEEQIKVLKRKLLENSPGDESRGITTFANNEQISDGQGLKEKSNTGHISPPLDSDNDSGWIKCVKSKATAGGSRAGKESRRKKTK